MRRSAAEGHDVRRHGRGSSRLGISAIGEPAAGHDEQLGNIFRNMRLALKLTREGVARRLGVLPSVIDTFEAGVVTALPPWQEVVRIVGGYCELLRIDSEPILWRISSQLQAASSNINSTSLRQAVPAKTTSRSARREEREQPRSTRRGRRARRLFALSVPIALLAGAIYVAQTLPGEVYRAISMLPAQVAAPARTGFDYLVLLTAPRRDGLRWLETGDPKLRKADKLQTGTR